MTHRVVVWGTGNVGRPALRAVVAHKELELVGVIVHDSSKVGNDAGELCNVSHLGVPVTNDASVALASDVDAVVYAVNADFRPEESLEEVLQVLEAGANVVSTALYPLLHPPSVPEPLRAQVNDACQLGESSIFVSGIDPGWVLDVLPLFLMGMAAGVEEIRIQELANYSGYTQPDAVRDLCGFGHQMDYSVPVLSDFALMSVWAPMLRVLADGLGVDLEKVSTTTERRPLERTMSVDGMGVFEAGTQGAFRFQVEGHVDGRPLLVIEHVTRIDDQCAPEWPGLESGTGSHRVLLAAQPNITVTVHAEDLTEAGAAAGGNACAANRVVNSIPAVCQMPPGIVHPLDLPLILKGDQVRL